MHEANRDAAVISYLTEHGPTPRKAAVQGIARRYLENYTQGKSASIQTTLFRMTDHMRVMEQAGTLIRGPRPHQILSLPE